MRYIEGVSAFTFNGFDNVENDNSIIWEACKKELPKIIESELTERQAAVIRCLFFEGLTQTQCSKKLQISQPTVSRHLHSAISILLNRLTYAMEIGKIITVYYENEN